MTTIRDGKPTKPERRNHGPGRCVALRDDDLAALLPAAASGEQRAWSLIVGRFSATIRAVARSNRLSPADQDEVAQRTWLRLIENIERIREPGALGGWLATTARRECHRVTGSGREIPAHTPLSAEEPDPATVEDAAEQAERRAALHTAIDVLPDRQRRLMRMLLAQPALSFDELSVALAMPRGSLGATHGRSVALLRQNSHLANVIDAGRPD
jgi:RNA polymerase sigma factor (sigma-70 family)